jgi:hypothetical protein
MDLKVFQLLFKKGTIFILVPKAADKNKMAAFYQ